MRGLNPHLLPALAGGRGDQGGEEEEGGRAAALEAWMRGCAEGELTREVFSCLQELRGEGAAAIGAAEGALRRPLSGRAEGLVDPGRVLGLLRASMGATRLAAGQEHDAIEVLEVRQGEGGRG
jgi:hypothetical protein